MRGRVAPARLSACTLNSRRKWHTGSGHPISRMVTIQNPGGPLQQLSSFCFLLVALVSDVLLIRLFLVGAYVFLFTGSFCPLKLWAGKPSFMFSLDLTSRRAWSRSGVMQRGLGAVSRGGILRGRCMVRRCRRPP